MILYVLSTIDRDTLDWNIKEGNTYARIRRRHRSCIECRVPSRVPFLLKSMDGVQADVETKVGDSDSKFLVQSLYHTKDS
jgi:hypothetical protein